MLKHNKLKSNLSSQNLYSFSPLNPDNKSKFKNDKVNQKISMQIANNTNQNENRFNLY